MMSLLLVGCTHAEPTPDQISEPAPLSRCEGVVQTAPSACQAVLDQVEQLTHLSHDFCANHDEAHSRFLALLMMPEVASLGIESLLAWIAEAERHWVKVFAGEGDAVLITYQFFCKVGSHDASWQGAYVYDSTTPAAWQLGFWGYVIPEEVHLLADGWVVMTHQPTAGGQGDYVLSQVVETNGRWQLNEITSRPTRSVSLPLVVEANAVTIPQRVPGPHPCRFAEEIEDLIYTVIYRSDHTYLIEAGAYVYQEGEQMVDYVSIYEDNSRTTLVPFEAWQDYCLD